MNFKHLRSRFKGDKSEEQSHQKGWKSSSYSDTSGKDETFEVDSDREDDSTLFHDPGLDSPESFKDQDERGVFEQQLTQLQEQLVGVMIENQNLQTELNHIKKTDLLDKLKRELEFEKKRSRDLVDKCKSLEKKRKKVKRSSPERDDNQGTPKSTYSGTIIVAEDTLGEDTEWTVVESIHDITPRDKKNAETVNKSRFDRVWESFVKLMYEILEDFSEVPSPQQNENPEGDTLSPTKLKDNIMRFGAACKPYVNTAKGFYHLVTWKSPPYSLIVFIVYMYSVYMGWFLPLVLFCLAFRLFISYLRHNGWSINFNFFDTGEEENDTDESKDLTAKFNLVVLVARKAQNILGSVADSLEKVKNLLSWRHPSATKQIFFVLICGSFLTSIFPANYIFYFAGLYFGVKIFIIDYLYLRFPRLKQKYDTTHKTWLELPTDAEYEKRHKYDLPKRDNCDQQDGDGLYSMASEDRMFCELFSLPFTESPLPDWRAGKRCTLINRHRSIRGSFKNGKLFLTRSFLCFEKTKSPSPSNIVISLTDITKLEKAKPFGWMPGGGMAIEIAVVGSDKTMIFGAMLNRDEVYDCIINAGKAASLPWAGQSDHSNTDVT